MDLCEEGLMRDVQTDFEKIAKYIIVAFAALGIVLEVRVSMQPSLSLSLIPLFLCVRLWGRGSVFNNTRVSYYQSTS